MKKLLLTLIVSLAFCGSIFAQNENPNGYESHWAGLESTLNHFEDTDYPVFYVKIDGNIVTMEDRWYDYEFASFVDGEYRGSDFMTDEYLEYGWIYPMLQGLKVKFTTPGETVSFQMYDHATGILYELCESNFPVVTGEDCTWDWDYFGDEDDFDESALFLLVTSPAPEGFVRTVIGYDDPEGKAGYALIASPIGTVDFMADESPVTNLITETAYDLFYFNQNPSDGLEWINQKQEGFTTLEAGKGYLYANDETTDITFTGAGNTEAPEIILEHAAGDNIEMAGWNLVGNPFGVDAFLERDFYTMNGEGSELMQGSGAIEPTYGVFVYATEEEDGQPLTFTVEDAKSPLLALNLSNGRSVIDRASVRFGEGRTLPKFQLNRNSTKVYIPVDNEDYAVVRSEGIGELPVNFKAESNGTYSLTLSSENVDFSYLHLVDNMTGVDQDMLANPSYSFSASTTDYASRFRLVFATGNDEDSFAFFSNGSLFVNNEGSAVLQVVDVTGRIIKSESINGCANVSFDAVPGVYMVRLVNGDNMKVQKVVK